MKTHDLQQTLSPNRRPQLGETFWYISAVIKVDRCQKIIQRREKRLKPVVIKLRKALKTKKSILGKVSIQFDSEKPEFSKNSSYGPGEELAKNYESYVAIHLGHLSSKSLTAVILTLFKGLT